MRGNTSEGINREENRWIVFKYFFNVFLLCVKSSAPPSQIMSASLFVSKPTFSVPGCPGCPNAGLCILVAATIKPSTLQSGVAATAFCFVHAGMKNVISINWGYLLEPRLD